MTDDLTELQQHCAGILGNIDPAGSRSGTEETPIRMAKALMDMTSGYDERPEDVLKTFEDGAEHYDQMVFQGSIPFYSLCEHHVVPFFGVAHIGYIPSGRIAGLSKLARLVELFAKRLQVQERLTSQIANALNENLKPVGVGVVIKARHMCMESRGVKKPGTITYTSALLGAIREEARGEFMHFVDLADRRTPSV